MAVVFLKILVICICLGPVTFAEEIDCYNRYNKGIHYTGNISQILSGLPCLKWNEVKIHPLHNYTEDHNYCRNPLPSEVDSPYCYTTKEFANEKCVIPVCDCRNSTNDFDYNGNIKITRRGHNCQKDEKCRAPADNNNRDGGPWCNTGLKNPPWDYCNVPICESAKCPDLSGNPNLKPLDGKTTYRYGEIVMLTCNIGYRLNGSENLTCQQSGQWNNPIPHCQVVTCPHLEQLPNQKLEPAQAQYSYRDNVTFKCDEGYELSQANTMVTCQGDGTWSNIQPNCREIGCYNRYNKGIHYTGNISKIPSGQTCLKWSEVNIHPLHNFTEDHNYCRNPLPSAVDSPYCYTTKSFDFKKCVIPVCDCRNSTNDVDYNGNINITRRGHNCQNNEYCRAPADNNNRDGGPWCNTGLQNPRWDYCNVPVCESAKCPDLSGNPHLKPLDGKTIYRYGEIVILTCETGYKLNGSYSVACQTLGLWNDTIPSCQVVNCPHLEQLPEQTFQPIQAQYLYRDNVTFKCDEGYELSPANSMVTCQSNGTWSNKQPNCTGVQCPPLPTIDNALLPPKVEGYRYPDTLKVTCETGYVVEGYNQLQCNSTGLWGFIPQCKVDQNPQAKSSLTGIAVGLGTAFALLVVVICVIIYIRRRRSPDDKGRSKPLKDPKSTDVYAEVNKKDEKDGSRHSLQITTNGAIYNNEIQKEETREYYSFAGDLKISETAISMNDFYDYVDKGRGTKGPIEKEFAKFKKDHLKETKTASMTENTGKNKYKNVFPYDETRVILDLQPGKAGSDYINASFINGYGKVKTYIAAQGPLESTINDFWRMIWQYDCGKIVMLTNVFELGKPKCKQYWPDPETKTKTYGSTEIVLIDEDVYSDFTIRTLKIVKENHSKTVKQFHFTAWPDKDVPKYASSIVHFRHKVLSSKVSPNGPIIIHCSAGIGRTGTFIALDYIVNEAKELKYIDVFKCVETLRRQRVNMVQTARQYVFLHEAILEAVMCPNSGIPSKDFPDLYKKLMLHDSSSNKSNLQLEYQRMNAMCEKHEDNVFDKGKIPENRNKNRDSTILPVECEMPILSTFVEGHNEYINAVFLPGYKNKKAFIVTQMPLDHTKIDLWRLVYDHNIQTIVMLNQVKEDTEAYWPENQETPIQIGAFEIELTAMESKPYCNCLHLTFKYKTWDERSLVMYQANFWNDNAVVPDSKGDLFNLLFEVENKSNNGDDSPILVHCLNGCDKSGLYCVLATVLERLRIEQDIDIQHIIKQTRNKRPQIILNYEQFRFIYDAVLEYLKQFETYANFQ